MILITNDDGIDAPGIETLTKLACERYGEKNVWVVAPAAENSQVGHRVTTGQTLKVEERGTQRFAVHGTPADCTRLALSRILPKAPEIVLSGINFGGNLGRHDFVISGTVAAAREAAFHGIGSIALSNFHRGDLPFSWEKSATMTSAAIDFIENEPLLNDGEFWVVNMPHSSPDEDHSPEIKLAWQEAQPLELMFEPDDDQNGGYRYTGRYHERPASPGSDVAVCFGGDIAVTRVWI